MRRRLPAAVVIGVAAASCGIHPHPRATPMPPIIARHALDDLVGEWRWAHVDAADGVTWIERERWWFVDGRTLTDATPPTELRGRYLREVEFVSTGEPFACNQQDRYTQRATFDVTAAVVDGELKLTELAYRAEVSPCDHGFRQLGSYQLQLGAVTATLRFDGGSQTLLRGGAAPSVLPTPTWPGDTPTVAGTWTWRGTLLDAPAGERRIQTETWTLALDPNPDADAVLTGLVERTIEIQSADGSPRTCAAGAAYRVHETVTLAGQAVEDRYLLRELDATQRFEPPDTTCRGDSTARVSDSAYVEQVGDVLLLEWRGKRRQVLVRPQPAR